MTIELTDAEARLLADVLDSDYRDLKEEIHRTETFEYKEALKEREALMIGILSRLGRALNV